MPPVLDVEDAAVRHAFLRPFPTDPLVIGGLLQLATGVQQLLGTEVKAFEWNAGALLPVGERPGTSRNLRPADTTASSHTGNHGSADCTPMTTTSKWVSISPSTASSGSSPTMSRATLAPADWESVAVDFSMQLYSAPGTYTTHRFIAQREARAGPCLRLSLDEHRQTSQAHPPRLHQRRRSWSGAQASAAPSENEQREWQNGQRHKRSLSDGEQLVGQLQQQPHEGGAGLGPAPAQHPGPEAPRWLEAVTVLAGAASRTLAQVAIHPLDTLKTRMQVSIPTPQLRMWRAVTAAALRRPAAALQLAARWASPAGARDLFLGLPAAVVGTLPSSLLYFGVEQGARGWLADRLALDRESAPCRLLAATAAACLSALVRVPADVVKHRVQAYAYPSTLCAARDILSRHGARGLYAGFGATLLRDAPEVAVQFAAYAQLKKLREAASGATAAGPTAATGQGEGKASAGGGKGVSGSSSGLAEHMMLGGAAGAVAALATTPLDVVKTQLQCGAAQSVASAVRHVLRTAGPAGLFNGLAPRLLQTTLCSAIFFTLFESSKAHLRSAASAAAGAGSVVKGMGTCGGPAAAAPVCVRVEPAAGAGWMYGRQQQPYGAVWLWDECSQLPVCYHQGHHYYPYPAAYGTCGSQKQQQARMLTMLQAHEMLLGPAAGVAAGRRAGPWARVGRSSSGSGEGGRAGRTAAEVPAAA